VPFTDIPGLTEAMGEYARYGFLIVSLGESYEQAETFARFECVPDSPAMNIMRAVAAGELRPDDLPRALRDIRDGYFEERWAGWL
jgi:hypothetical protein